MNARDVAAAVGLGLAATAVLDLWTLIGSTLFGMRPASMAPVGRWIGHMSEGQFLHDSIRTSAPVVGEVAIGWSAHYLVGAVFGVLFIVLAGRGWLARPTLLPALAFGVASVAAPFLLMQPAMGSGIAASLTPDPFAGRMRSLSGHAVFGLGLFAAGWLVCQARSHWGLAAATAPITPTSPSTHEDRAS